MSWPQTLYTGNYTDNLTPSSLTSCLPHIPVHGVKTGESKLQRPGWNLKITACTYCLERLVVTMSLRTLKLKGDFQIKPHIFIFHSRISSHFFRPHEWNWSLFPSMCGWYLFLYPGYYLSLSMCSHHVKEGICGLFLCFINFHTSDSHCMLHLCSVYIAACVFSTALLACVRPAPQ